MLDTQYLVSVTIGKYCKKSLRAKQQISSWESEVVECLDASLSTGVTSKGREAKVCQGITLPFSVVNISSHNYVEVKQKAETENLRKSTVLFQTVFLF